MPEPLTRSDASQTGERPFPWFCPRCRQREVRRTTVPYQCQRLHQEQPIIVNVPNLGVPKCANCGELVFDYEAEEQINQAYQTQTSAFKNGPQEKEGTQTRQGLNP